MTLFGFLTYFKHGNYILRIIDKTHGEVIKMWYDGIEDMQFVPHALEYYVVSATVIPMSFNICLQIECEYYDGINL